MVGTIGPMVHGRGTGSRAGIVTLFAASHVLGGALVGAMMALIGYWVLPDIVGMTRMQVLLCSIGCVLFSLHEARLLKLVLPQFRRQVPRQWRNFASRGVFLYGIALGAGIGTRIVSAALYVVLIGAFFSRNIAFGTVLMAAYGLARGLPVAVLALLPVSKMMALIEPLLSAQQSVNLVNAAILAHVGVLLWGRLY